MNLKQLSKVDPVLDLNDVASALMRENNISIETEADFERLFPDQFVETITLDTCLERMYKLNKSDDFVDRIMSLPAKEKICILSDYDADGICSALIMQTALDLLKFDTTLYIPDRLEGGYSSFSEDIIKDKIKKGYKLFITLDCGISMKETSDKIMELGGTVIVTDHHLPGENVPENCLIVDPKYNNDESADICGALVAFKLAYALSVYSEHNTKVFKPYLRYLAFLAGVATVTDMMPMLGENRLFVKFALECINNSKANGDSFYDRDFIYYFVSALGGYNFINDPEKYATEELISYYIGPTLNAISRIGDDVVALVDDLYCSLTLNNKSSSYYIHSKVSANYIRRTRTKELLDVINEECNEEVATTNKTVETYENNEAFLIEYDPKSFEFPITGLFGIVANKLTNTKHKVSLVGCNVGDGLVSFSCRSEASYNLHTGIERITADHPEFKFSGGGHAQAMGVKIAEDQLENFFKLLTEDIEQYTEKIEPTVYEFTSENLEEVAMTILSLAPYGQGFQNLKFLYRGVFYGETTVPHMYNVGDITIRAFLSEEELANYTIGKEVEVLVSVNCSSTEGIFFTLVRSN